MKSQPKSLDMFFKFLIAISLLGFQGWLKILPAAQPVKAAGGTLTVEIIAAPNLVVDSNALSPSTYAPKVATVIGKFCNVDAINSVDNVTAYIGDYTAGTPGEYPERTDPVVDGLTYEGTYAFQHLGGAADAARFLGDLAAGQCVYQYWSFEYPHYAVNSGVTIPTWGASVKPGDDLSLNFDVWVVGDGGAATANAMHTSTMRNEISAMANKIKPNGNPAGKWFNTDTSTINVGETITTNGILYRLGNVNQGFDNDNDGVPDYNAWVQPFGDPSYDPSCFRLVGVTGVLTVTRSAGNPDMVIPFENNLYFTNLPSDNTNVRGEVFYEFLALGGACTIPISPYQEVASGSDNEKFNGDYGAGVPGLMSYEPEVVVVKIAPGIQAENTTLIYQIPFTNTSATSELGLVLSTVSSVTTSLMISDTVPTGLTYVGGSAAAGNTVPSDNAFSIRYSTDGGQTYSTSDPGSQPSTVGSEVIIQWWLENPLDTQGSGNNAGEVTFQALIPTNYINNGGDPFIENCATGGLADGQPFTETCATTLVQGVGEIGNRVWLDDSGDGIQNTGETTQIDNVMVSLYWDKDGNGVLDGDDVLVQTQDSGFTSDSDEANTNYNFTLLPDGNYLVVVNKVDSDIDTVAEGFTLTTEEVVGVSLSAGNRNLNDADFGFGPTLAMEKVLVSSDPAYLNEDVTFTIDLFNTLPGDGTANGFCTYKVWASIAHGDNTLTPPGGNNANSRWANPDAALGRSDFSYATTGMRNTTDELGLSGFNSSGKGGNIQSVKLLLYMTEVVELQDTDGVNVTVYRGDNPDVTNVFSFNGLNHFTGTAGDPYVFETAALIGSWSWNNFTNNASELHFETTSAPNSGDIGLDAAAYVITTDELCGGADSTITTLPVTDTYDADHLEFQYAVPSISEVVLNGTAPNTVGTLTWNNVGPLYAGGTGRITVTFKALSTTAVTTNTALVDNARFATGRNVNDVTDAATVGINDSGSIAGTVWADTNGNGWQGSPGTGYDAGDTRIPNVKVSLMACYDPLTNALIEPPGDGNDPCTGGTNDGEWRLVDTQMTSENGDYLFEGLRDGFYNIIVDDTTLPANFTTNSAEADPLNEGYGGAGGDDQWNDPTADLNNFNSIVSGEDIANVSFGYVGTGGVIVGYVWHDEDGDGIWDDGEIPIPNVDVYICMAAATPCNSGNASSIVSTDENGFYHSTETPADYRTAVDTADLPGMSQTGDPDIVGACGASCDDQVTASFTLGEDEIEGPYNFGYQGGFDLSGTVFTDWNGSGGNPEAGEEGIGSVPVILYRDVDGDGQIDYGTDTVLSTTVTASDGTYAFSGFPGNGITYLVVVNGTSIPAGYEQTADYDVVGTCSGAACDDDASVTITTTSVSDVDFGFQPQGFGSIGDTIWADDDGNGEQNASESGINGVTVILYQDQDGDGEIDPEDALVDTEFTINGTYTFTKLFADSYIVFVPESNFDDSGDPPYSMTQTNGPKNSRHTVNLGEAENYIQADFGYTSSSIGDLIWSDNDGDGVWLSSEPGIPGVVVELHNDPNNTGDINGSGVSLLITTTTGSDGLYLFGGLAEGNYIVRVANSNFLAGGALENHILTGDPNSYNTVDPAEFSCLAAGAQECNGINELQGITAPDTTFFYGLQLGQNDMSSDFGYRPQGVVGDKVWIDTDGDGQVDIGENGIPFITVNLCSDAACSSVVMSTTTDTDGNYSFGGVVDGTYYVEVDTSDPDWPPGLAQTSIPDGGSADNQADGVVLSSGSVTNIGTVSCSNCDLNIDFGYQLSGSGSISGHVFFDGGNDGGTYDSSTDTLYGEITVYLENSAGVRLITTTASVTTTFGATTYSYIFPNLPDDTYNVTVGTSSPQLDGLTLTEPSGNSVRTVTVSGGSDETNEDFGFYADLDFGDLPDGYRTTLAKEGPNHSSGSLTLGTVFDTEGDGQPDPDAGATGGGDDGDGTNDDDGIVRDLNDLWVANASVDLLLTVTGGTGLVAGWFDWDGDGIFDQLVNFGSVVGSNQIRTISIPASYVAGTSVNARFRLFDVNGVPGGTLDFGDYIGSATDGEVEDYQWPFHPNVIEVASFTAGSMQYWGFLAVVSWIITMLGIVSYRRQRR